MVLNFIGLPKVTISVQSATAGNFNKMLNNYKTYLL